MTNRKVGTVEHIIDGVLRFQREVYPNSEALYRELAISQSPMAMFIGCSDSRVVPEVLTGQDPGSLFVVRNAGNIIPPSSTEPGGVTASIEYAVRVLGIPDIIVCGHSGCGAIDGSLEWRGAVGGYARGGAMAALFRCGAGVGRSRCAVSGAARLHGA